jgi:hypothetical protein
MSDEQLDLKKIRERVEKRVNARKELITHAGVYLVVNAVFWVVWLTLRSELISVPTTSELWDVFALFRDAPIAPLLSASWGIGLLIHALVVFLETGVFDRMQEREMEREIARERQRLYNREKPKRQMRLSDDGELVAGEAEDEADPAEAPAHRQRAR